MAAYVYERKIVLHKCEEGIQVNLVLMPYRFEIMKDCSHTNFDLPLVI